MVSEKMSSSFGKTRKGRVNKKENKGSEDKSEKDILREGKEYPNRQ